MNEDTTETFHITPLQTDPMTIVEFSDTDKQNYSTSSSSNNLDNEDPEAVLLPVSIEETVKTATIETVESVPLDEDTNNGISKTPFQSNLDFPQDSIIVVPSITSPVEDSIEINCFNDALFPSNHRMNHKVVLNNGEFLVVEEEKHSACCSLCSSEEASDVSENNSQGN